MISETTRFGGPAFIRDTYNTYKFVISLGNYLVFKVDLHPLKKRGLQTPAQGPDGAICLLLSGPSVALILPLIKYDIPTSESDTNKVA